MCVEDWHGERERERGDRREREGVLRAVEQEGRMRGRGGSKSERATIGREEGGRRKRKREGKRSKG